MRHCLTLAGLALALLLSRPAVATTRIHIDVREAGGASRAQILTSGGRVRLTISSAPRQEILFSATDETLVFIRHDRKEFTRLKVAYLEQAVGQVGGIAQQLQNQLESLPPEKREQLGAMLEGLGLGGLTKAPTQPARLIRTGQKAQAAAIHCEWWQLKHGDTQLSRMCLAGNSALKIDTNDYRALRALLVYVEHLNRTAGTVLAALGVVLPSVVTAGIDGLPILLEDHTLALSATILAVDRLDVPLQLRAPPGYRETSLPAL